MKDMVRVYYDLGGERHKFSFRLPNIDEDRKKDIVNSLFRIYGLESTILIDQRRYKKPIPKVEKSEVDIRMETLDRFLDRQCDNTDLFCVINTAKNDDIEHFISKQNALHYIKDNELTDYIMFQENN